MSFKTRLQIARDRKITVANLTDELLRLKGDCEVGRDVDSAWTLSELQAEVAAMDAFLRSEAGLQPGQLVVLYRTNDHRCFRWLLAIIRAGGIAVPLNPQLSLPEVSRILRESGATTLITDTTLFQAKIHTQESLPAERWIQDDDSPESLPGMLRYAMRPNSERFPPAAIDPKATVAIFHTSGTSGFPKGAALSSNALLAARSTIALTGLFLGPRDLAFVALPWSHIMAVSIALYGLMAGIPGCFLEHFDVERALDLIEGFHVTTVVGVPAIFTRLVNAKPAPRRLRSVRVWLSASDHLPSEIRRELRGYGALRSFAGLRIPPLLLNGYGMVELGGLAMLGIEFALLPGSGDLCFPVPPFQVRIVDENGNALRANKTGELQIRRSGMAPHYWKQNGDNAGVKQDVQDALLTADGWLRTGDLARRNHFGMVRLVGRIKEVIKSGGYSVYVPELEATMLEHPAVARAAAFGLPHADKGEIPAVAVELHAASTVSEQELVEWCRERLAPYKAPRRIWILKAGELPQNQNGKLLRRVLRERLIAAES
ncbi:MAG TPA: class I adenylate-forming enzyme family protein [Acidobacteriaceae bacterium]|nr:class I adenylate-forming enzyme family protein [Acidobacteriaceae bacterium]